MKINVKEWLNMHPVKRYIKLQEVAGKNGIKKLTSTAMQVSGFGNIQ